MKVNGQWVPCVRNSSFSFISIVLKLYRCLDLPLKMCKWFEYNPQNNIYHLFRNLNLVIFLAFTLLSGYLVCATSTAFMLILLKLHSCYGQMLGT